MVNVDEINAWVTSAEACQRLGIRSQTLYAYVSRGRLTPRKDGRRSLFSVDELDGLAANGRRGTRQARLEVLIDTELTLLEPEGRLAYRGVDVTTIAGSWSFERGAEWLWTGIDRGEPAPWTAPERWLALADGAAGSWPADRLRSATAAIAADRPIGSAAELGRPLIAALVEAFPPVRAGGSGAASIAERLWPRLSPLAPTAPRVAALDAALLLLADHELAVSTVAVRVASSSRARPVDCVLAGLATHGGALHGGVSSIVQEAIRSGEPAGAGFGHTVYVGDDPRAGALLPFVRAAAAPTRWQAIERAARAGEHPNVDLALGGLAHAFDMVEGAGEAIFALARVAGWLAHAQEEHGRPFRFRPRASYVGVRPPG